MVCSSAVRFRAHALPVPELVPAPPNPVRRAPPMLLEQKLESGKFAVIAEMEPPKGTRVADLVTHAKRVKDRVAAFLVPEMNHAVMRMSALGGAMVLQAQGMDAVMQVCCRDRNRLALQGDLLAAAACGV